MRCFAFFALARARFARYSERKHPSLRFCSSTPEKRKKEKSRLELQSNRVAYDARTGSMSPFPFFFGRSGVFMTSSMFEIPIIHFARSVKIVTKGALFFKSNNNKDETVTCWERFWFLFLAGKTRCALFFFSLSLFCCAARSLLLFILGICVW